MRWPKPSKRPVTEISASFLILLPEQFCWPRSSGFALSLVKTNMTSGNGACNRFATIKIQVVSYNRLRVGVVLRKIDFFFQTFWLRANMGDNQFWHRFLTTPDHASSFKPCVALFGSLSLLLGSAPVSDCTKGREHSALPWASYHLRSTLPRCHSATWPLVLVLATGKILEAGGPVPRQRDQPRSAGLTFAKNIPLPRLSYLSLALEDAECLPALRELEAILGVHRSRMIRWSSIFLSRPRNLLPSCTRTTMTWTSIILTLKMRYDSFFFFSVSFLVLPMQPTHGRNDIIHPYSC